MPYEDKKSIIAKINNIRPRTFSQNELSSDAAFSTDCSFNEDFKDKGKIFVDIIKIDRYIYHLPEKPLNHWHRLFKNRNYERTIFATDISQSKRLIYYVFPGRLPKEIAGSTVVLVGKYSVDMHNIFEGRKIGELIAIITRNDIDYENYFVATNNEHWKILSSIDQCK
jgi:hypothetical protein